MVPGQILTGVTATGLAATIAIGGFTLGLIGLLWYISQEDAS